MLHKNWFVHVCEQTLGPLSEPGLLLLLRQGRVQFVDFAWTEGMDKWERLLNIPKLANHLPPFPSVEVPSSNPTKVTPRIPESELPTDPTIPAKRSSFVRHEFRREDRATVIATVRFDPQDEHDVVNISETGLLLKLKRDIPMIGKEVRFLLIAREFEAPLEMTGILVREQFSEAHQNFVAIEFTKINPIHRRQIKAYVDRVHSQK
jgi:hypothetical protein